MIARALQPVAEKVPPLNNGDQLDAVEFCRRWDSMPNLRHAELIGGQVYMNPPVSAGSHGLPNGQIIFWLGYYAALTEGVEQFSESSVHFGSQDLPQPDAILRVKDQFGGMSRLIDNELHGAPELVVEVAASSASYDLFQKKQRYQENGVLEYLVWVVHERRFVWFALEPTGYVQLTQARNGIIKSRLFPGLWLDTKGMLGHDQAKVLATANRGLRSPEYIEFAAKLKAQGRKKRKSS
jgi:Uma2 family endonuclease